MVVWTIVMPARPAKEVTCDHAFQDPSCPEVADNSLICRHGSSTVAALAFAFGPRLGPAEDGSLLPCSCHGSNWRLPSKRWSHRAGQYELLRCASLHVVRTKNESLRRRKCRHRPVAADFSCFDVIIGRWSVEDDTKYRLSRRSGDVRCVMLLSGGGARSCYTLSAVHTFSLITCVACRCSLMSLYSPLPTYGLRSTTLPLSSVPPTVLPKAHPI